jgi:WD40 repeat protein
LKENTIHYRNSIKGKLSIYIIRKITCSVFQNENKNLVTGSEDGYIKLFDYKNNKVKRMFNICNFQITCMTPLLSSNLIAVY